MNEHWTRRQGGIRKLCGLMQTSPEAIYAWFRGDNEPQLGSLTKLAEQLGVTRVDVLAAMDGVAPRPDEALMRRLAREEAENVLERELDAGRLRVLRGGRASRPPA